jgi:hypothetical protein
LRIPQHVETIRIISNISEVLSCQPNALIVKDVSSLLLIIRLLAVYLLYYSYDSGHRRQP